MKNRWIQQPKSTSGLPAPSFFCVILFLILSFSSAAQASPGDLDPSFGTGGIVTTSIGTDDDEIFALAVQPDGKLVAAGYSLTSTVQDVFALARYNTDGSLDTTFGAGGIVTTPIGTEDDKAFALVIQPDGKLVAAGYSHDGILDQDVFALVRYNTDGSLDTTFNPTGTVPGIVTTPIGTSGDEANALAIQPDGKLVAAGYSFDDSLNQNVFALVRYWTDGSLDTTFGAAGIVTTPIGTSDDEANALAVQTDGKLVAAGYSYNGSQYEFAMIRYNADGSLDTTFNPTGTVPGIVTTPIGNQDDKAFSLSLQTDGKLVAGGYFFNGFQYAFAAARYNTDGTLDGDFGEVAVSAIGTEDDKAFALVIQSDGKLVQGGYSKNGPQYAIGLVRYNTDGSLDTSFGTDGVVTTAIGDFDQTLALAIQPDGKLVAAGFSYSDQYSFALARYLNDTSTTTTTTTTSTTSTTETTTTTITSSTTTTTTTTTTSTTTTTQAATTTTSTTTTSTATTTTTTTTTTTSTTTSTTTTITTTTASTTTSTEATTTTTITTTTSTTTTTTTTITTTTSTTTSTTTTTRSTTTTTICRPRPGGGYCRQTTTTFQ